MIRAIPEKIARMVLTCSDAWLGSYCVSFARLWLVEYRVDEIQGLAHYAEYPLRSEVVARYRRITNRGQGFTLFNQEGVPAVTGTPLATA